MHGKGSFVQKLLNTQNNFNTKILRFLVQAGANVYTHTLIRPSNGRGCHNHLFVGKFIPLLTGQEYESHLYSSTKKGPADLKNQIDMALSC